MATIISVGKYRVFNIPYRTEAVTINIKSNDIELTRKIGTANEVMLIKDFQINNCITRLNLNIVDVITAVVGFISFLMFLSSPTPAILFLPIGSLLSIWSAAAYRVEIYYGENYIYEFIVPSKADGEQICKILNDIRQNNTSHMFGDYIFKENSNVEMLRYIALTAFILLIMLRMALQ